MDHFQAKNLFHVKTELIEAKVNIAASNALDRVLAKIDEKLDEKLDVFKNEMSERFSSLEARMSSLETRMSSLETRISSLETRMSSLENRMIAVETNLGMVNESQRIVRNKFIDYAFQSGWLLLNGLFAYAIVQFHMFIK